MSAPAQPFDPLEIAIAAAAARVLRKRAAALRRRATAGDLAAELESEPP